MRKPGSRKSGFTFVEILVAMTLLALLFVPMMQLFSHAMEATNTSRDLITAISLARWEMERVKNLGNTTARLKAQGNLVWPPLEEPPLVLNSRSWRIHRVLETEVEPLQVTVEVRREGEEEPLARLVTLLTDYIWSQQRA